MSGSFLFGEKSVADSNLAIRITAENLARAAFQEAEQNVDSLQGKLSNWGQSMIGLGSALTAGITLPLMGIGTEAVHMAADFDSSMQKIVALVGVGQDQVNAWKGDIMGLSEETGIGSKEMADALFFITSAGLRGSEAMDALKASAEASVAGLGDMKPIADALTSAMNAYATSGLSAEMATSILIAAVREGKMPADALASSIGRVLPVAAQMGVSFDQVGASIASMTRTGLSADEATTALRGVLVGLLKPTGDATKAMASYGLSAAGLRQEIRDQGLLAVLETLKEKIGDNDAAWTKIFPNVRAVTGVLSLVGENAAEVRTVFEHLAATTTDDLATAFNVMSDTSAHKLNVAMNAIKESLIALGDVLIPIVVPAITSFAMAIVSLSSGFANLDPPVQHAIVGAALFAAAVGPILVVVGSLALVLSTLAAPIILAVAAVAALGAAFAADFGGIRTTVEQTVGSIIATMQHLQADDGLGGVDALLTSISMHLAETFGPDAAHAFDVFTSLVGQAADALGTFAHTLSEGDFSGAFSGLFASLGQLAPQVLDALGGVATAITGWISQNGPIIAETFVTEWLPSFITWFVGVHQQLFDKLGGLVNDVIGWIGDNGAPILETFLADWVPSFTEWVLGTAVPQLLGKLAEAIPKIADGIAAMFKGAADDGTSQALPKWEEAGLKLVGGVITGIEGMQNKLFDAFLNFIAGEIAGVYTAIAGKVQEIGSNIVTGITQGVQSAAGGLGSALTGVVTTGLDQAKAALGIQSPSRIAAQEIGIPLVQGIAEGIYEANPELLGAVAEMVTGIADGVTEGEPAVRNSIDGLSSAVAAQLSANKGKIKTAAQAFFAAVLEVASDSSMVDQFGQAGSKAVSAIGEAFQTGSKEAGTKAADAVKSMIDAAEKAGVPGARDLGAQILLTLGEGLAEHSGGLIAAGEAMIAQLNDAMKQAALDKIVNTFDQTGEKSIEALRLKLSPDAGGGIVNVFNDAMVAALDNGTAETVTHATQLGSNVIAALKLHLGPEEATSATNEFLAAFNSAWSGGDLSGLSEFFDAYGSIVDEGSKKSAKSFDDMAQKSIDALRVKLSPDEGGGVAKVFMEAIGQQIDVGGAEAVQHMQTEAAGILNALKTHLSPAEAYAATLEFQSAVDGALASGDLSGLDDFFQRFNSAFADGFDKAKRPARTAADAFMQSVSEVALSSQSLELFGQYGSKAAAAIVDAFDNGSKESAAKVGNSIQEMIQKAEKIGVPQAAELGAAILSNMAAGFASHDMDMIDTALSEMYELNNAMVAEAEGNSATKLAASFGAMGTKATDALKLKLSPAEGGGLANVFVAAMTAEFTNGSKENAKAAEAMAQDVINAITSDKAISPSEANTLVTQFNAVVQDAFKTGDLSGVKAWIDAHLDIVNSGLAKINQGFKDAMPTLAGTWHDAALGIKDDFGKAIDGMSQYTDQFVQAQQAAAAAIQKAYSSIQYGGYGNQGYQPPIGTPGNPGPAGLPPNSPGNPSGGPITPPTFGSSPGGSNGGASGPALPSAPNNIFDAGIALEDLKISLQQVGGHVGDLLWSEMSGNWANDMQGMFAALPADQQLHVNPGHPEWELAQQEAGSILGQTWDPPLFMALGGTGIVNSRTHFIAGEGGPERFSFTPLGSGVGGETHVHVHLEGANIYGVLDFEQHVVGAVTAAVNNGALTQPIQKAAFSR